MFLRTRRARCEAVLAGLFITVLSRTAAAQSSEERAQAQALFDSALKAVDKGNDAEGCPKFEAAFALYASPSTMIQIARCHERAGRVASAWAAYRRVSTLLSEAGSPERRKALEESSNERAAALEPRLPRLKITFAGAAPGGSRGGAQAASRSRSELGLGIPLDQGAHAVRAHEGLQLFEASVRAGKGSPKVTIAQARARAADPPKASPSPSPKNATPRRPPPRRGHRAVGVHHRRLRVGVGRWSSRARSSWTSRRSTDSNRPNKDHRGGTSCLPGYDYAADNLLKERGVRHVARPRGAGRAPRRGIWATSTARPREVATSFAPMSRRAAGATTHGDHPRRTRRTFVAAAITGLVGACIADVEPSLQGCNTVADCTGPTPSCAEWQCVDQQCVTVEVNEPCGPCDPCECEAPTDCTDQLPECSRWSCVANTCEAESEDDGVDCSRGSCRSGTCCPAFCPAGGSCPSECLLPIVGGSALDESFDAVAIAGSSIFWGGHTGTPLYVERAAEFESAWITSTGVSELEGMVATSDSLLLGGFYRGSLELGGKALPNAVRDKGFVARCASTESAACDFVTTIEAPTDDASVLDVAATPDERAAVVGERAKHAIVAVFDPTGTGAPALVLEDTGAGASQARAICTFADGSMAVAGWFTGQLSLGSEVATATDARDTFVAFINATGAVTSLSAISLPDLDNVNSIACRPDNGSVVLAGSFVTTTSEGFFFGELAPNTTDMSWSFIGTQGSGAARAVALVDTNAGLHVLVTGRLRKTEDFGLGPLEPNSADAFYLRLDGSGQPLEQAIFTGDNRQSGERLVVESASRVWLGGTFETAIELMGTSYENAGGANNGDDWFLVPIDL
ncbi:MAG: hypothetical protein U0271_08680 [Polyangiaceae bacterium]